jgi:hypothetical protein
MEEKYEPLQGQVGTEEYMSPEMKEEKEFLESLLNLI